MLKYNHIKIKNLSLYLDLKVMIKIMQNNNAFTKIFTHKKLPFLELRYSSNTKHYKEHLHDTFSIGINLKGKSIYTNKNNKYNLDDESMIAVVNANTIHSCNPIDKAPNLYYMMYLDENWCYGIQNSISPDIDNFKAFPENILYNKKLYEEFKTLCMNLFSNISYMEREDELIVFFTKLFGEYIEESKEQIENEKFEEIKEYLNKNYQANISLDELSKKFDLNPFYIIRLFKTNLNITPHSYLLNIKINKAKEFLKDGYSIVDTALECGFSDQSHFHRNFLKIVATTPKEYKLNFVQD